MGPEVTKTPAELAACTIVSKNYLAYARTLARSFKALHPDIPFYVLLVDQLDGSVDPTKEPFCLVEVESLGIPHFKQISFQYDILELNTNVKPTFLKHLLASGHRKVLYLDPDIRIYSQLSDAFGELDAATILLTPHTLGPIGDGRRPSEQDHLLSGVFNLGFIGVRACEETAKFLDWWERRCLECAFNELRSGLFVDQKWVSFAPCYFPGAKIFRHEGCNVAYWNLQERMLGPTNDGLMVNAKYPLVFFHFSGLPLADLDSISRHQDRLTLAERPDLRPLFEEYRRELLENGHEDARSAPYAYGRYSNGREVSHVARRYFSVLRRRYPDADPFDADGPFYSWGRRKRILATKGKVQSYNSRSYNPRDIRVRLIKGGFIVFRYIFGPDTYAQLMKYLGHISTLRNQEEML